MIATMDIDKGYAWIVMMANFGAFSVTSGLLFCSGIIMTTLQERFGEDVTKAALVGSLLTALSSFTGPIGSLIISRTSCRIAVMTGATLMTLGFLITAFSTNLNLCIFSCGILAGSGCGINFSALYIVNGFHFKKRLNLATGISSSGGGTGIFLLAPLLEKSKELYGYPGLFTLAAGASLQLFVFAALMRPSDLEVQYKLNRENKVAVKRDERDLRIYLKIVSDKATICLISSFAFYCGGLYTAYMFWPSLCLVNGFSALQASYLVSVSGVAAVVGRIAIGLFASHSSVDIFVIYSIAMAVLGIPFITLKFYASLTAIQIIAAIVIGAFSGAPIVLFTSATINCVGLKYLSHTGGLLLLFGGISSIVTPVICGYVITGGGSYGDAIIICGACIIVSAGLVILTKLSGKKLYQESQPSGVDEERILTNRNVSL